MSAFLATLQEWVWGIPLILLLLLTGLHYTVLLRGLQFRRLGLALWFALINRQEPGGEGDISHFQALMTALAATIGTGNIVGVATAIGAGGPGALFWMWVTGLLGMATKYAEAVLGVRFRETDAHGQKTGGPMYYLEHGLEHGLGGRRLGRFLAVSFAIFASVAAFGIGNGIQSQAIAASLHEMFHVPLWVVGLINAAAVGLVIVGGIRSIGRVASVLVPVMILLYLGAAGILLLSHIDRIPEAFELIFQGAFGGRAMVGGALGYTVLQAMRFGVARGVFSNESGLGTGAIAAAAARTNEPVRQALVSMTQPFIDTLVVCTFTGLAIITTGAWSSGAEGATMTQLAFERGLSVGWGDAIVAFALATFAFSTMLGWSYYGERSVAYLFGERVIRPYRLVFVLVVGVAAVIELDVIWLISDVLNGLMAAPNLLGLLLLSGVVWRETRSYFGREVRRKAGSKAAGAPDSGAPAAE